MKKVIYTLLFLYILAPHFSQAQPEEISGKTTVALLPLSVSMESYRPQADQIQELVGEILKSKSNLVLRDRSKDAALKSELNNQKEAMSFNAYVVEQGKVSGGKEVVTGKVTYVGTDEKNGSIRNPLTGTYSQSVTYTAVLSFSLQVLDVATGEAKAQKTFNFNGSSAGIGLMGNFTSADEALKESIKNSRKEIEKWINMEAFPPDIKILRVETKDGKGNAKEVMLTGVDKSIKPGTTLTITSVEVITSGDKTYNHDQAIGELKVKELQGEVAIATVTKGKEVLEGKMNDGTKLRINLKAQ